MPTPTRSCRSLLTTLFVWAACPVWAQGTPQPTRFPCDEAVSAHDRLRAVGERMRTGSFDWEIRGEGPDRLDATTEVDVYGDLFACAITLRVLPGNPAQRALELAQAHQRGGVVPSAFFVDGLLVRVSPQGPPDREYDRSTAGDEALNRVVGVIYGLSGPLPKVRLWVTRGTLTLCVDEARLAGTPLLAWLRRHEPAEAPTRGLTTYRFASPRARKPRPAPPTRRARAQ